MRVAEIRSRFLDFYRDHGHEIVSSSPVVPHDDPTLLFANAGMNQFKSVFTGLEPRENRRACSSQKCIRAGGKHNDLDNVGYTARHLTFFEMLGNFSFGDYFKKDACRWAWQLVTDGYGVDPDRLWISVFEEDDEAREIWIDEVGVSPDRIVGLGEKDNFWSMGDVGPCGPCSELHVDRGLADSCGSDCALGVCDCDRWMEIWNLVFMQYEQQAGGSRIDLPRPSIDTGMGLERITMILQDKKTVFETDLLAGIIEKVGEITGVAPSKGPEGTPHRVISDHLRSLSFAIADGAFPSNEERGYVLRRILRRASRYGYKLGMEQPFIHQLVAHLVEEMGDAYPEISQRQPLIEKLIHAEEEQFLRTLKTGMTRFDDEVKELSSGASFPAPAAFFLHDSCGFPIDLTEQMAREVDRDVDRMGFDQLMEKQRTRSRQGSKVGVASEAASDMTHAQGFG
ncbi:MAG: alanine--tRNA ligase, partial [Planctomycetota bacterium]